MSGAAWLISTLIFLASSHRVQASGPVLVTGGLVLTGCTRVLLTATMPMSLAVIAGEQILSGPRIF
jgi:hypothetical protein